MYWKRQKALQSEFWKYCRAIFRSWRKKYTNGLKIWDYCLWRWVFGEWWVIEIWLDENWIWIEVGWKQETPKINPAFECAHLQSIYANGEDQTEWFGSNITFNQFSFEENAKAGKMMQQLSIDFCWPENAWVELQWSAWRFDTRILLISMQIKSFEICTSFNSQYTCPVVTLISISSFVSVTKETNCWDKNADSHSVKVK